MPEPGVPVDGNPLREADRNESRPRRNRNWLEYLLGPHFGAGISNVLRGAAEFSIGADVREYRRAVGRAVTEARAGRFGQAAGHAGLAAATIPMFFMPGTIASVKRGTDAALDAAYRGIHTAPERAGRNTLDDIADIFPDDIYSPEGVRYYGHGGDNVAMDATSIATIRRMRGRPNQTVTVYRAVPHDSTEAVAINPGDWVTINRRYAKQHGESSLGGNYRIASMKVRASDLATDGNSIHEWGYSPTQALPLDEASR